MSRYPAPVVAVSFAKPSQAPAAAHGPTSAAFRSAQVFLGVALVWGAVAFGAVYPWAFWPLAAIEVLLGGLAIVLSAKDRTTPLRLTPLVCGFGVFAIAVILQLVPVPLTLVGSISPDALHVIRETDFLFASGHYTYHSLSVTPALTAVALVLFVANAIFMLGCVRLFSVRDVRWVAAMISAIGVALALAGMIQGRTFNAKIYGFWTPTTAGGSSFGPFVNRNHFAGWMLMALPITLGLFGAELARATERAKSNWRDRLLWLSSPAANRLLLLAVSLFMMALSLIWTMSRSGMLALALALGISAPFVVRRQPGARWLLIVSVALAGAFGIVAWAGVDEITARFAGENWASIGGRLGAWSDAIDIARRFPWVGTGLNTYGVATHLYQQHDLVRHYSQAHNDFLQIYAEGGLLLTLPAAACVVILIVAVRRRFIETTNSDSYWMRAGAVVGLIAIGLQELADFSLQMPGNAALFAVLCAIALHRTPNPPLRLDAASRKLRLHSSS